MTFDYLCFTSWVLPFPYVYYIYCKTSKMYVWHENELIVFKQKSRFFNVNNVFVLYCLGHHFKSQAY